VTTHRLPIARAEGCPVGSKAKVPPRVFARAAGAALLLLASLVLSVPTFAAAPTDVQGWRAARWGMDGAALDQAFGESIDRLPGRWEYGGAYATRGVLDIDIAGYRFNAFFQMNDGTDRLQQVLLEGLRQRATQISHRRVIEHFRGQLGEPTQVCHAPRKTGDPEIVAVRWRFPSTTVHVGLLDFHTTAVMHYDPNIDTIDPRVPSYKHRIITRRSVPRRIIVRFHPADREDLFGKLDCLTLDP